MIYGNLYHMATIPPTSPGAMDTAILQLLQEILAAMASLESSIDNLNNTLLSLDTKVQLNSGGIKVRLI